MTRRAAESAEGLVAGAVVSFALLVREWLTRSRAPKILEVGTALLFSGLALYTVLMAATWSVIGVRLCIDSGLLLIVLASMALRRPFTLQYARERIAPAFWDSPAFVRTNYVITAGWAIAFGILVIAEAALLYVPGMPPPVGIIAIILALVGAVTFTGWYSEHIKRRVRGP